MKDSDEWPPGVNRGPADTQNAHWRLFVEGIGNARIFCGSVDLYWREDAVRLIEFLKRTAGKEMVSVVLRGPNETVEVFR